MGGRTGPAGPDGPGAAALFFGWRARRHGRTAGLAPAAIGGSAILSSIALNVLAFLIGR
ncbi:MAG TPA: hypothetical protein VGF32_05860 [Streptosporangiaceae bacterium]